AQADEDAVEIGRVGDALDAFLVGHRLEQLPFLEVDDVQRAVGHVGDEQPVALGVEGEVVELLFGPAAQPDLLDALQNRWTAAHGPKVRRAQRHGSEKGEQTPAETLLKPCHGPTPCSVEACCNGLSFQVPQRPLAFTPAWACASRADRRPLASCSAEPLAQK